MDKIETFTPRQPHVRSRSIASRTVSNAWTRRIAVPPIVVKLRGLMQIFSETKKLNERDLKQISSQQLAVDAKVIEQIQAKIRFYEWAIEMIGKMMETCSNAEKTITQNIR
jgi:hypothetical protein